MTLTKKKMVREIGRRTRLKNREVQQVIETLIDVWTEALVAGEKIEIENFLVMEVKKIDRGDNTGMLQLGQSAPRHIRRVIIRVGKKLKIRINNRNND